MILNTCHEGNSSLILIAHLSILYLIAFAMYICSILVLLVFHYLLMLCKQCNINQTYGEWFRNVVRCLPCNVVVYCEKGGHQIWVNINGITTHITEGEVDKNSHTPCGMGKPTSITESVKKFDGKYLPVAYNSLEERKALFLESTKCLDERSPNGLHMYYTCIYCHSIFSNKNRINKQIQTRL